MLYREGRIRVTNLTFIFWDLFYPLGYLLLFGVMMDRMIGKQFPLPGVEYNAFFLAGVLGMAGFGIAANTSWSFFLDRDNGILYEMLTYPMSRAEYLGAKVLFNVFIAVVQALITVLLAAWLLDVRLHWERLPLLIVGVMGGTAGWFYFYAIFALRIRRNDVFNAVTSVFYFAFLFLSSMFYPLEPLPEWFRRVALVNPITWHVDVLRYATIGLGQPERILAEALAFTAFTLASFVIAVRVLQQQE